MEHSSFSPARSNWHSYSGGRVVDHFVDGLKRTFSNTPLSTCDMENSLRHRGLWEEENLTKIVITGFEDHLNVGVSSPKAPKSGEENPAVKSELPGYASKVRPALA